MSNKVQFIKITYFVNLLVNYGLEEFITILDKIKQRMNFV